MLKKRFVLIFLVLAVLLASIVVILQLNSRNQAAQSVNFEKPCNDILTRWMGYW